MIKRKIKFPLRMDNNIEVRSIEELRENFNIERVMEYFFEGKLSIWLKDRGCTNELENINILEKRFEKMVEEICNVIGVENYKYNFTTYNEEIRCVNNEVDECKDQVAITEEISIDDKIDTNSYINDFKVKYRKTITKCSGNITIIEPDGSVSMLGGSQTEIESIPKFESKVVDIANEIAVDENGRAYQWGLFLKSIPQDLPKIKQVASCPSINIVLDEFGVIHDLGRTISMDASINMPKIDSKIIQIGTKGTTIIALDEFGKVYCWGKENKLVYSIPTKLPRIRKVELKDNKTAFALDENGKVHFWGENTNDIIMPHMLPRIVDISISDEGEYCIGLDEKGKVHILAKLSMIYKVNDLNGIVNITPYGGLDNEGKIHKYIEGRTIVSYHSHKLTRVKLPNE